MAMQSCHKLLQRGLLLNYKRYKQVQWWKVSYSNQNTPSEDEQFQKRVFSGIQPTGVPHIGNYFGAIRPWVIMQEEYESVIYCIVDMHAITLPHEADTLRKHIKQMVVCLLASGIDPKKSILFQQSSVGEHAELSWILGCLTTLPRLNHLPQWKEKSQASSEVPLGLFTYPVLQSADILLYKATDVPVGDDQVKHIELTSYLAKRFNTKFGNVFPKPNVIIGNYKRIRSLRNPETKMSKSETDSRGRIELLDSPELIKEKCKKAVTDMLSEVTYDPENRPGVSNLVDIYAAFADIAPEAVVAQMKSTNTLGLKMQLADLVIEKLKPIREEAAKLEADPAYIDSVLQDGAKRAQEIASETYGEVRKAIGFI